MDRPVTHLRRRAVLLLVSLLTVAPSALAQVTTGTLVGAVTDAQGRPLPRADVRLVDEAHHVTRTTQADESGLFRVVDVAPAAYDVTATASGFREATQRAVTVRVNTIARVDLQLALAGVRENVTVTAVPEPVQTAVGLGVVLDRQRIDTLPLNGRHFLQLSLLAPGVQDPVESSELSSRGAVAMHANGAREEYNNFLLDGVDNNDPYVNRYVVQPSVDSIEEFKVATNGYSAEYGRNAGGQVNVVTRRGTNRFSGSANEYFRDRSLNAANYFET